MPPFFKRGCRYRLTALLLPLLLLSVSTAGCLDLGDDDDEKDEEPEKPIIDYPYEELRNFTTYDLHTNKTYTATWAIFRRAQGGNCCEHYLATTSKGWITNLGGEYPTWSEDRGVTWQDFRPITDPFDGLGEGAIIETPDGDIVANSWYPYPPYYDELIFYYYNDNTGDWSYLYDDYTHPTFYDRSWQCVVPGPISGPEGSSPWASLIVSNFWSNSGAGYIISQDGLYYWPHQDPSNPIGSVSFDLDFEPGTMWDYLTPHREMDAVSIPSPQGGLLMPNYFGNGESAYLDTNLIWRTYTPPADVSIPAGHLVIDSTGALHSVEQQGRLLIYHLSLDGGRTWTSENFTWEKGERIEEWEFKASGEKELAVINMRMQVGEFDQDMVFHIRDYRESQKPDTLTLIGKGDLEATSGAGNPVRFDFASLGILPDGGVVVSYFDTDDDTPLFALELEMPYDDNPFVEEI